MSDYQLVDRDQIENRLEEIQGEILRLFEYNRKLDDSIRNGSDLAPTLRSVHCDVIDIALSQFQPLKN